ncbi:uncharacterized protein [Miscanthus floridulus]|uniref:uncharacterized protein n=1 Tax=Miscanthus floridulus TaxID=154761 RepID=UPI00345B390C
MQQIAKGLEKGKNKQNPSRILATSRRRCSRQVPRRAKSPQPNFPPPDNSTALPPDSPPSVLPNPPSPYPPTLDCPPYRSSSARPPKSHISLLPHAARLPGLARLSIEVAAVCRLGRTASRRSLPCPCASSKHQQGLKQQQDRTALLSLRRKTPPCRLTPSPLCKKKQAARAEEEKQRIPCLAVDTVHGGDGAVRAHGKRRATADRREFAQWSKADLLSSSPVPSPTKCKELNSKGSVLSRACSSYQFQISLNFFSRCHLRARNDKIAVPCTLTAQSSESCLPSKSRCRPPIRCPPQTSRHPAALTSLPGFSTFLATFPPSLADMAVAATMVSSAGSLLAMLHEAVPSSPTSMSFACGIFLHEELIYHLMPLMPSIG